MFERYSEKSRRVIFFARYEASQWGESYIQPTHLLLGLVREAKQLFVDVLHTANPFPNAADELQLKLVGEKVATSVDLPLSMESKRALVYAAEESERLGHATIEPGHLLLGLLRQPGTACNALERKGLTLPAVREILKTPPQKPAAAAQTVSVLRAEFRMVLLDRLKPELEPAVVYSLRSEEAQ
jgi:ATP-dependent Clp protease ATP-binding subunit ClpC